MSLSPARERFLAWRSITGNDEKATAHDRVKVATRARGGRRITLSVEPCVACGSEHRIHGHHEDHRAWWDVTWVCGSCHAKHHRGSVELPNYARPEPLWQIGYWQSPDWAPADHLERAEELGQLESALNALPYRERDIALGRVRGLTLDTLGKKWGLTRERVRQIEARVEIELRSRLEAAA